MLSEEDVAILESGQFQTVLLPQLIADWRAMRAVVEAARDRVASGCDLCSDGGCRLCKSLAALDAAKGEEKP